MICHISRRFWPLALMVSITLASHFRVASFPAVSSLPFDKWIHFCVFGLLSTSLIRVRFAPTKSARSAIIYAVFTTTLFGLFDEVHQSFNPNRFCSFWDLLADFLGALVAAFAYAYLPLYRNLLERPLYPKSRLPSARSTSQIPPC